MVRYYVRLPCACHVADCTASGRNEAVQGPSDHADIDTECLAMVLSDAVKRPPKTSSLNSTLSLP